MSEPRMRARPKGSQFAPTDLEAMLTAFGDDWRPLPETVRVLDEIVTDFIIETAHLAAVGPQLAQRNKIKIDDFKFALRKDPRKLGRVTELLALEKEIKRKRKAFEVEEDIGRGVDQGDADAQPKKRGRRKKQWPTENAASTNDQSIKPHSTKPRDERMASASQEPAG